MKKLGVILLGAMALACGSSELLLLFAQVVPNLSSGPRDVFYAQSELLRSLDESWYTPLSRSMVLTRIPDVDASDLPTKYDSKNRPPEAGAEGNFITKPQDKKSSEGKHFRWGPAIGESLLYTGIMHTFDLSMQAGTRDSLNGHWFQHYAQSVSELRGWSDSDTFMAPYVGHPLEGSIFGYIERQNDPKYHLVQLGDGRAYWISLLRSMAYSAVWHTQWKIGPVSEDSIANVMLHASPGFITLVDTPTLGLCTMLAEDAVTPPIIGVRLKTSFLPALKL